MLSPDIADAARHCVNAHMLNQAHGLDRQELDAWLDRQPSDRYVEALRVHAHLLAARPLAITEGAAR